MRGVLKAHPGFPSRSRRIRPPVARVRLARISTDARAAAMADSVLAGCGAVGGEDETAGILLPSGEWRRRSTAVFGLTIFMMASPHPVQEPPPASRSA